MERLTKKRDRQNVIPLKQNGETKWVICSAGMGDAPTEYLYGEHADRLAAYEDTGLEPEDFKRTFTEDAPLKLTGQLLGVTPDRLRELAQADREGRCVVLPCKPSDVTVYQLRNKKHARGMGVSPRHVGSASVWGNGHYALHHQGFDDCLDRDFGKTWFLTEEEAEAALRREQDG